MLGEACRFWSRDTFTNKQHILLMFISVWLLDLINDMAVEKKKNCCVKSLKIIQQKRWAASVVQMGTRSQRSEVEIIAGEEYPQSSMETEMGQLNWKPYLQAIYPLLSLSNILFVWLTDPFSPPTPKRLKYSKLGMRRKKNPKPWNWANRKLADIAKYQHFSENKPLWRFQKKSDNSRQSPN